MFIFVIKIICLLFTCSAYHSYRMLDSLSDTELDIMSEISLDIMSEISLGNALDRRSGRMNN